MTTPSRTLFSPIVPQEKLHPLFETTRTQPASEPARWMLDDVYQSFTDPDGNFLEQFQSAGFEARLFELYLYAYFSRTGFHVDRSKPRPDFIVSRGGTTVAVESTTVNPPGSGVLAELGREIGDLTDDEHTDYERNELPIRFGSALFSKLNKRYWELPQCKDLPLVIAIEAFHDKASLSLTDASLTRYLYGIEQTGHWQSPGRLGIETAKITDHKIGPKTIPSGFFAQADAEHVSAVLFTNSASHAKFSRMGFQHGIGCDTILMSRKGFCYNPERDAMDPTLFAYSLDAPPLVEPWGQGLVIFHNPRACHPLPRRFFPDATPCFIEAGTFRSEPADWHPITSLTALMHVGAPKAKLRALLPNQFAVVAIPREEFHKARGYIASDPSPLMEEHGWFMDESGALLGVIVRDKIDDDWGYVILGRDREFVFRPVVMEAGRSERVLARVELQQQMAEILSYPQRIFPRGCAIALTKPPGERER